MAQYNWEPYVPPQYNWEPYDPSETVYQDQPSKLGSWLDTFNKYDQPIFGDATKLTAPLAEANKKSGSKLLSSFGLDWIPGSGIIRELYKKPEDRNLSSMIPGFDTYKTLTGLGTDYDPREPFSDVAIGGGGWTTNELTRPSTIADLALTAGAGTAAKLGSKAGAKWLTRGSRALAAPIAAGGVRETTNVLGEEGPWDQQKTLRLGGGILQTGLGTIGTLQPTPKVKVDEVPVPTPKPVQPIGPSEQLALDFGAAPPPSKRLPSIFEDAPLQERLPFEEPYQPQSGLEGLREIPPSGMLPFDFEHSYEGVFRGEPFPRRGDITPPAAPAAPATPATVAPTTGAGAAVTPSTQIHEVNLQTKSIPPEWNIVKVTQASKANREILTNGGFVPSENQPKTGPPIWVRKGSPQAPPPATQPMLPAELKAENPRHRKGHELLFESDLDRAFYQAHRTGDPNYIKFITETAGIGEEQIGEVGNRIVKIVESAVGRRPPGPIKIKSLITRKQTRPADFKPINEKGEIIVPADRLEDETFLARMSKNGLKLVGRDANGDGIFKRLMGESKGEYDPQQIWENLKQLFKRDPTEEEVATAMARQVTPGEMTGRVARFPGTRESEQIDQLLEKQRTQGLTELENTQLGLLQEDLQDIRNGIDPYKYPTGPIPRESELVDPIQGGVTGDVPAMRGQNQLQRIDQAEPVEGMDLGPAPGMEDFMPPRDEPSFERVRRPPDDLFKGSEGRGLGKESFEEQWDTAIKEAEILGINWSQYDNLDELQWEITKETAQRTVRTGKNPFNPGAEDPVQLGFDTAALQHHIRGELPLEPWEARPHDPPYIAELRKELDDLNFEQEARLYNQPHTAEGPVLSPEEAKRFNELHEELSNFDEATGGGMDKPNFERVRRSDMPYDPSIGGDARQRGMGTFRNMLENSSDEELLAVRDIMARDLEQVKGRTANLALKNEAGGSARRRIIFAQKKLDTIDNELTRRAYAGNEDPKFARTSGGGHTASSDIRRSVENITRDYTRPLSAVMNREGMQNGLDAADALGTDGVVKVRLNSADKTIEIYDNGKGLDEEALSEKLFKLFATGKEGEQGATGGKGIGSASYIYGGKHFEIDTVAVDRYDGLKHRIKSSGTPEQFLDPVRGSDVEDNIVPMSTPTGTTIKVFLKDNHDLSDARDMLNKVTRFSRNRPSSVIADPYGMTWSSKPLKDVQPGTDVTRHKFASSKDDKLLGDFVTTKRNSKVEVLVPKFDESIARSSYEVHYLNNGMYQFSERKYLDAMGEGIPPDVLIDIHPLVDDQDELYPFINTREDVKGDIRAEMDKFVKDNISSPGLTKRKNRVQDLYDSMAPVAIRGTKRKPIIFDPGNRLTPQEMKSFTNHPVIVQLTKVYDRVIDDILTSVGRPTWANRLEGVGIVLDPGMNGVHIPNPTTGKSTILINPFLRIDMGMDPRTSAYANVMTNLHEVGHIGKESKMTFTFSAADKVDPRLPEYFAYYMNQLSEHGDVGYSNTGHKMDYAHRLGEVYARFGIERTYAAVDEIHGIFTGGRKSGDYSPEVQGLLQLYKDSRGRPEVTEDLLSPTGEQQANRGRRGAGNIPSNPQAGGGGTPSYKEMIDQLDEKIPKDKSYAHKMYDFVRAITTTGDLSAALRQGSPLMYTKHWWKAWKPMIQSGLSGEAYETVVNNVRNRDMFREEVDLVTGEARKSFAEDAGLALPDSNYKLNRTEEAMGSEWVETGEMFGKNNAAQRFYKGSAGRYAKASNRAYNAYLMQLRADTFEDLVTNAKKAFDADVKSGTKGSRDPFTDKEFTKEIAEFVNTATGRGSLKLDLPSFGHRTSATIGGKEVNLPMKEISAEFMSRFLSGALFAPRLVASRLRMLNPGTYLMASPFVRKQYMKAAISMGTLWGTSAFLASQMGAEVNTDSNSSDFGKIRIGNTRIDPAAGFQQYWVALHRLASGKYSSSSTGRTTELGEGFKADSKGDVLHRFAANKLHPVIKFGHDLLYATQYQPFQVGDRLAQLFVPLIVQDVVELMHEDPSLLPLVLPLVTAGMGTQTYEKGEAVSKFMSRENDPLTLTGGESLNSFNPMWSDR